MTYMVLGLYDHLLEVDRDVRESTAALREEARMLGSAAGERSVTYRNSGGEEFEDSLSDILSHVALHASYSRGQLALLIRRAGEEPDWTEYIGFVRGAPTPARDQVGLG